MLVQPDWVTVLSRVVAPLGGEKSFYRLSEMTGDMPLHFSLSVLRVDVVPGSTSVIGFKPLPRLSGEPSVSGGSGSVCVCDSTAPMCGHVYFLSSKASDHRVS